jgi:hypothetical protein
VVAFTAAADSMMVADFTAAVGFMAVVAMEADTAKPAW